MIPAESLQKNTGGLIFVHIRRELLNNTALLESIEEYQTILSLLCKKFNYAVDTLDIIKWLKNIPNEHWEDASWITFN